jgi:hypothetical protein
MPQIVTYDNIDRPYGPSLSRVDNTVSMNDVTTSDQNMGGRTTQVGSTLTDLWIDTWIKSTNYSPKQQGFWIDGQSGYIEAVNSYFSGEVVALSGHFGTQDNYWEINSTGITAISTTGDISINYGKTAFGQDAVDGFILGINGLTGQPGFEIGNATGSLFKYDNGTITVTGGQIQTSSTGARVVIGGVSPNQNDIFIYDDSTGGGGSITGNIATIQFPRTDLGKGTFFLQKRKSTISNTGNVFECFYDAIALDGSRNYIFLGEKGNSSSILDYTTHVIRGAFKDLLQIGSSKTEDHDIWGINKPHSEIEIITDTSASSPSLSPVYPDVGASQVLIGAIQATTPTPYNPTIITGNTGGGAIIFGIQDSGGFEVGMYMDYEAVWLLDENILPYFTYSVLPAHASNLGSSSKVFASTFTHNVSSGFTVGNCGLSNDYWGNVYSLNYTLNNAAGAYINWNNNHIQFNGQTNTVGSIFATGDIYAGSQNGSSAGPNGSVFTGTSGGYVVNRNHYFYAQSITYKDGSGTNQTKWFLVANS